MMFACINETFVHWPASQTGDARCRAISRLNTPTLGWDAVVERACGICTWKNAFKKYRNKNKQKQNVATSICSFVDVIEHLDPPKYIIHAFTSCSYMFLSASFKHTSICVFQNHPYLQGVIFMSQLCNRCTLGESKSLCLSSSRKNLKSGSKRCLRTCIFWKKKLYCTIEGQQGRTPYS